jgi:hypothetical protein
MRLISLKHVFHRLENPCSVLLRKNLFLRRHLWVLLLPLLILLGGQAARSEIYSVQAGAYKILKNAEKRYASLLLSAPETRRNTLRIEKSGDLYAVRIGRFESRDQAERLLPSVRSISPDAFIRKGEFVTEDILKMEKKSLASPSVQAPEKKPPVSTFPLTDEKPTWKVVKPIPPQ